MSLRELSLFDRKLPEETLHPVENVVSFGRLGPLEGRLCGQLLHQPLLLGIELGGDRNIHHDQYIAASVTVHVGQALAGQPQHLARRRTRCDLDPRPAIDRRNLDRTAEQSRRNRNIQIMCSSSITTCKSPFTPP